MAFGVTILFKLLLSIYALIMKTLKLCDTFFFKKVFFIKSKYYITLALFLQIALAVNGVTFCVQLVLGIKRRYLV